MPELTFDLQGVHTDLPEATSIPQLPPSSKPWRPHGRDEEPLNKNNRKLLERCQYDRYQIIGFEDPIVWVASLSMNIWTNAFRF